MIKDIDESTDTLAQDIVLPNYYKIHWYSLKNYPKIINAMRSILAYLKIWFKVISNGSDLGYEYVSGINAQINAIHQLTYKYNTPLTNVASALYDLKNNTKLAVWLTKLSKEQKAKIKYFQNHLDIFKHTRKWIKDHQTKATAWINKNFSEKDWKLIAHFKKLADWKETALSKYKETKLYNKLFGNASQLDDSLAGNYLNYIMNLDNKEFNKIKKSNKAGQAFIASAYHTIALVFDTTKITIDIPQLQQKLGSINKIVGLTQAVATHKKFASRAELIFRFTFNNNTQYGNNDAYNDWMDNQHVLNVSNDPNAFARINWNTLLKNCVLIHSSFKDHNPQLEG